MRVVGTSGAQVEGPDRSRQSLCRIRLSCYGEVGSGFRMARTPSQTPHKSKSTVLQPLAAAWPKPPLWNSIQDGKASYYYCPVFLSHNGVHSVLNGLKSVLLWFRLPAAPFNRDPSGSAWLVQASLRALPHVRPTVSLDLHRPPRGRHDRKTPRHLEGKMGKQPRSWRSSVYGGLTIVICGTRRPSLREVLTVQPRPLHYQGQSMRLLGKGMLGRGMGDNAMRSRESPPAPVLFTPLPLLRAAPSRPTPVLVMRVV